jgi:hypothetical protein
MADFISPLGLRSTGTIGRTHSHALSPDRKRRKRGSNPQPGSIYDIMRQHASTSLYVMPMCWTDLHTKLLDVTFVHRAPIVYPVPGPVPDADRKITMMATGIGAQLSALLDRECSRLTYKQTAIKELLSAFFPETLARPTTSPEISLYFGARAYPKAVRCPVLWNDEADVDINSSFMSTTTVAADSATRESVSPQPESQRPSRHPQRGILAYVNRELLDTQRRTMYRVAQFPGSNKPNLPILGLQKTRGKNLQPANIDKDPHFIGLIIALAQSLIYTEAKARTASHQPSRAGSILTDEESHPDFKDVPVRLITVDEEKRDFIVYTAEVSAEFLQRFENPSQVPRPRSALDNSNRLGLTINYRRIPIWPIFGLKERMAKALGPDLAGDMTYYDEQNADETMELWETPHQREARLKIKRKRAEEKRRLEELASSQKSQAQSSQGQNVQSQKSPQNSQLRGSQTQSSHPRNLQPLIDIKDLPRAQRRKRLAEHREDPHDTPSQRAARMALLEAFSSSLQKEDEEEDDTESEFDSQGSRSDDPLFSPSAKRRCTRPERSLQVC